MRPIDFNIGRVYSRSLLGANIAPSLVSRVLKKIYSLEMVENDICLESESKQNALLKKRALKNVPMPPMSRIVPDRRETLNLSDFIVKLMEDFSTVGIE